ncbi:MAG: hypothetical protein HYY23_18520 [Verrucomicrobia bacterium]|nr:hypothetical protein [Verrucomicrobiota bacterium]
MPLFSPVDQSLGTLGCYEGDEMSLLAELSGWPDGGDAFGLPIGGPRLRLRWLSAKA